MTERLSKFQRVLLGVESTYGDGTAATKLLPLTNFELSQQAEFIESRAAGKRYHSTANITKDWSQWNLTANEAMGYHDLAYILSAMYDEPTPVNVADEYTWTFESVAECEDASASYNLLQW